MSFSELDLPPQGPSVYPTTSAMLKRIADREKVDAACRLRDLPSGPDRVVKETKNGETTHHRISPQNWRLENADYISRLRQFTDKGKLPSSARNELWVRQSEARYARRLRSTFYRAYKACELREKTMPLLFLTITYDDAEYWRMFVPNRDWDVFKQHLLRAFRKIDPAYKLQMLCVTEPGEQTGRWHHHALLWVTPAIARFLGDPAAVSEAFRHHQEVEFFKKAWRYGFCRATWVRYGRTDLLASMGWLWPLERKGGVLSPVPERSLHQAAGYLTSYMSKQIPIQVFRKEVPICRTRMTRGLGLESLDSLIQTIQTNEDKPLLDLMWTFPTKILKRLQGIFPEQKLIRRRILMNLRPKKSQSFITLSSGKTVDREQYFQMVLNKSSLKETILRYSTSQKSEKLWSSARMFVTSRAKDGIGVTPDYWKRLARFRRGIEPPEWGIVRRLLDERIYSLLYPYRRFGGVCECETV